MALSPGTRLGVYEILSLLGVGGMGEVYRARDTKLNRDVAIKVLLASVANDPDRLARFSREAQVLASLNHPNIAHVHGFEDAAGVHALVMELVEGPTLADRIARGAIPFEEVLPVANQITEALEIAHEQGIIHRDLKPANIKVRPDGTVKVLDFGLAKALDLTGASSGDATISPTISRHATEAGIILGTAAYMSPEQARGKIVDRRTDVWAFGCVLYEMLTGTRAFNGDDVTDTIVAVVSKEPEWQALPATAAHVRPLIARCLKKDPKQRLQAIGDARIQIDELIGGSSEIQSVARTRVPTPARRVASTISTAIAVASGALIATLVIWALWRPAPAPQSVVRFAIVPPSTQSLAIPDIDRDIAISPDGHHIVYRSGPQSQLVVRAIDQLEGYPLAGITNARWPFFSSDSQWIGFFDGGSLKKVPIAGGSAIPICENQLAPRGASWGENNTIVFAVQSATTGLFRVSASGGKPTTLTTPDATKGEHWYPSLLPGGRAVLFTIAVRARPELSQIAVLDLKSGEQKTLIPGSHAEYVQTGHLMYVASGSLHAVRFDQDRLEVIGDPLPVVDNLWTRNGAGGYAISRLGTLLFVPEPAPPAPRSLVWVDRRGHETPIDAPPRAYQDLRISPDGKRVALSIRDQEHDIWILNLSGGSLRQLTFGKSVEQSPVWTEDSQRIVFRSSHDGAPGLFIRAADGTGTMTRLTSGAVQTPTSAFVAPDGTGMVGWEVAAAGSADLIRFSLLSPACLLESAPDCTASKIEPLFRSTYIESNAVVAPNGRFMVYQSNESGQNEIYVRPFPRVDDGLWRVSTNGGSRPAWARNGQELFYLDAANILTGVPVQTAGASFASGNPRRILDKRFLLTPDNPRMVGPRFYDVSPDGQRFLMIKETTADPNVVPTGMVVVLNWFTELQQRVPTR